MSGIKGEKWMHESKKEIPKQKSETKEEPRVVTSKAAKFFNMSK